MSTLFLDSLPASVASRGEDLASISSFVGNWKSQYLSTETFPQVQFLNHDFKIQKCIVVVFLPRRA
jgi:hypothetical protein